MQCSFLNADGTQCRAHSMHGQRYCLLHDPDAAEARAAARAKGGAFRHLSKAARRRVRRHEAATRAQEILDYPTQAAAETKKTEAEQRSKQILDELERGWEEYQREDAAYQEYLKNRQLSPPRQIGHLPPDDPRVASLELPQAPQQKSAHDIRPQIQPVPLPDWLLTR